jgi:hypothetical protein
VCGCGDGTQAEAQVKFTFLDGQVREINLSPAMASARFVNIPGMCEDYNMRAVYREHKFEKGDDGYVEIPNHRRWYRRILGDDYIEWDASDPEADGKMRELFASDVIL